MLEIAGGVARIFLKGLLFFGVAALVFMFLFGG